MDRAPELLETVPPANLLALVGHRHFVAGSTTVEAVHEMLARHDVDFVAVLSGDELAGVCARRDLAEALGSRFGYALNARRPVIEHLMPAPLLVETGHPLTAVFRSIAARGEREFFDDVVLVGSDRRYEGMIPMRVLVRLQTEHLLGNIARVAQSHREIAAKNRQMLDDLRMAREVQLAMQAQSRPLPATAELVVRLANCYRPASEVGGDFFDVRPVSDREVAILVCDVMGHGVRSALITAMVRALVEQLGPLARDPGAALTQLNADLCRILRQTGAMLFVTAAYLVLDLGTRSLRYAQAGHPAPLVWCPVDGVALPIRCRDDEAGPALGLIDDFRFVAVEQPVACSDRVVLYTDGAVEAARPDGEEFGPERFAEAVARCGAVPLERMIECLIAEIEEFAGGAFGDDVCVVAIELAAAAGEPAQDVVVAGAAER